MYLVYGATRDLAKYTSTPNDERKILSNFVYGKNSTDEKAKKRTKNDAFYRRLYWAHKRKYTFSLAVYKHSPSQMYVSRTYAGTWKIVIGPGSFLRENSMGRLKISSP